MLKGVNALTPTVTVSYVWAIKQQRHAMTNTTFTIGQDTFRVIEVSNCQDTPAFRELLISSGRDGNVYTAERVLTGRQRSKYTTLFVRHNSGMFDTLL